MGMIYGGENYIFSKNLQGDVIGIYNVDGQLVAKYQYNAFGEITAITDASGNDVSGNSAHIANINPFRYRGYYYDTETGLYYLQTRYYDPVVGRMLNCDNANVITATPTALTDKNLYAYCDNNPITRADNDGEFWDTVFDVVSIAISVVEVCNKPDDPWAWAGLVGDVVDVVVPFVGGIGEAVDVVKTVSRVVDKGDDIIDAAKNMRRAADAADDIKDSTGAYVVLYEQGQHYIGKGGFNRAITSATEHMTETNKVSAIIWAPTPSKESAFVTEYLLQSTFGLKKTYDKSYNLIWSPGRKLLDSLQ
jgi:RHS repeat-associated protein